MAKFDNNEHPKWAIELDEMALKLHGRSEMPTREEFYTNYPFFKYWSNNANEKLLNPEEINIYIHIPFCIQICDYCFYMKELIKSKDQVDDYVNTLCSEIKMISEKYGLINRKVNSIYMGGGTPSVLTEPQFKKLMETLHRYHRLDNFEFSFEMEPGTFTRNKLLWLRDCGVNRISMGVQSFNDKIIKLSSRKHTSAQAESSIKTVQDTGGFSINIDLLSGLAGETMDSWESTVATAMRQGTDMITVYKMKTYANTNFYKKGVLDKEIELPSEKKEITFMKMAMDSMLESGYQFWSNFAFTKNGSQSRYIEYTWRGQDLLAYGASSFGKLGNLNYQNLNNIHLYSEKVKHSVMPVYRTYQLSYKDIIVKELLLCAARLMSYSKAEFMQKFGFDYFDLIPDVISELELKGYITGNRDELTLTRQGVLFGDYVSKVIAGSVKEVFARDTIGFVY